jgi:hypothetical protein
MKWIAISGLLERPSGTADSFLIDFGDSVGKALLAGYTLQVKLYMEAALGPQAVLIRLA